MRGSWFASTQSKLIGPRAAPFIHNFGVFMPFQKGQSGCPTGRRGAEPTMKKTARAHVSRCISTLVSIADDESAPSASRVAAAVAVLSAASGAPLVVDRVGVAAGHSASAA